MCSPSWIPFTWLRRNWFSLGMTNQKHLFHRSDFFTRSLPILFSLELWHRKSFCGLMVKHILGEISDEIEQEDKRTRRSIRKSANIGSSRVLECDVKYPDGEYVQHIITWRKQGLEAPIFILFDGYPPRMDTSFHGRIKLVGQASIEISDIRVKDEGWYECSVLFLDKNDDTNINGTWIYLSVNCKSLILLISYFSFEVDFFSFEQIYFCVEWDSGHVYCVSVRELVRNNVALEKVKCDINFTKVKCGINFTKVKCGINFTKSEMWYKFHKKWNVASISLLWNVASISQKWNVASISQKWNVASISQKWNVASISRKWNVATIPQKWNVASISQKRNVASIPQLLYYLKNISKAKNSLID